MGEEKKSALWDESQIQRPSTHFTVVHQEAAKAEFGVTNLKTAVALADANEADRARRRHPETYT